MGIWFQSNWIPLRVGEGVGVLGGAVGEGPEVDAVGAAWLGVADGGTGEDHSLGTATVCRAIGVTEGGELVSAEATADGEVLEAPGGAGGTEEHEIVAAATARQNETRNNRIAIRPPSA